MQPIGPVSASVSGAASAQKPLVQPEQAAPQSAAARAAVSAAPIVNPSLRFDLRLGIVVVEFFDDRGEVANSAPSPRQLKAYEAGMNVRSGPMPMPRDLPAGTDNTGLAVVA